MNDDSLLRSLPERDVEPRVAERIRRRAHVILREEQRGLSHRRGAFWSSCYHRFVEPAVLIGLGLTYLAWTVHDTVALFQ